jgi:hypothetical protein
MNCSEPTQRFRPRAVTAAGVAALLVALVATAWAEPGNDNRAPELEGEAAKIRVEAGHKVAVHAYAVGVQIYRWTGTEWGFVGPEAILFHDDEDGVFGIHYGGPTWESDSGSKVVATVDERAVVDPDSIPWLRLKASHSEGPGVFDGITFIQRVNTEGGKAPSGPGEVVGEVVEVPYAAEYYFYREQR